MLKLRSAWSILALIAAIGGGAIILWVAIAFRTPPGPPPLLITAVPVYPGGQQAVITRQTPTPGPFFAWNERLEFQTVVSGPTVLAFYDQWFYDRQWVAWGGNGQASVFVHYYERGPLAVDGVQLRRDSIMLELVIARSIVAQQRVAVRAVANAQGVTEVAVSLYPLPLPPDWEPIPPPNNTMIAPLPRSNPTVAATRSPIPGPSPPPLR
jgi:hypothetical protein